ncbi:MAG: hypothetical protein AB1798_18770, partial [Spirochaetota bacterium]
MFLGRKWWEKVVILPVFLITAVSLYAGGSREIRLPEAEKLIQEKRYNDAIKIIVEIIKNEPEKMEAAEKLLDDIRKAREAYNQRYSELIDIYSQKELDLDKAYEIFKELEELDQTPNQSTVESFAKAKETAIFLYNKRRFETLMGDALKLINEGSYWEAVSSYLGGFDLHKEEYDAADYGNLIKAGIEKAVAAAVTASNSFIKTKAEFSDSLGLEVFYAGSGDIPGMKAGFDRLAGELLTIAHLRKRIFDAVRYIEEQHRQLSKGSGKEVFHLTYLNLLIHGRTNAPSPEGILGAIDLLWEKTLAQLENFMLPAMKEHYETAINDFDGKKWASAAENFQKAAEYAMLAIKTERLWESQIYLNDNLFVSEEYRDIVKRVVPAMLSAQGRVKSIHTYRELMPDLQILTEAAAGLPDNSSMESLVQARNEVINTVTDLSQSGQEWKDYNNYYNGIASLNYSIEDVRQIVENTLSRLQSLLKEVKEIEFAAVARMAELEYAPFFAFFADQKRVVENGKELLNGVERSIGEKDEVRLVVEKYPKQGREKLKAALSALTGLQNDLSLVSGKIEKEAQDIRESAAVVKVKSNGDQLLGNIKSLIESLPPLIAACDEQIRSAERFRQEGFARIGEAQAALRNNNFDLARQKLTTAGERFVASLSHQEDYDLRNQIDSQIQGLSRDVTEAENQVVISEVRTLINQGREFYTQGDFIKTESVLVRAQTRWKTTNVEENEEVEYWLRLARTALSMKVGRVLTETDPLYPEMSQLLNLARQDYLEGKALLEKDMKRDAVEVFKKAEEKLLRVLIPFPINQEAAVLNLRIKQLQDADNFVSLFKQKYDAARAKAAGRPQEAYIELVDLQQIF